jgi:hypothetical protein
MTGMSKLRQFLRTDPDDAGCAETFALTHIYVEREAAHGDAATRYPRVATHLANCGPCAEDYRGLQMLLG